MAQALLFTAARSLAYGARRLLYVICLDLISIASGDAFIQQQAQATSFTAVTCMAISPDGSVAAVGVEAHNPYHAYSVYLFSLADGRLLSTFRGSQNLDGVSSVAFSPDGKILAICEHSAIRMISLASGTDLSRLKDKEGRSASLTGVAFSRDGKYLAVSDEFGFRVWDPQDGKLLFDALGETERKSFGLHHLAISPSGNVLAAADADNFLEIDWRKNSQTVQDGHVDGFAFRPDGQAIAFTDGERGGTATRIVIRSTVTKRIVRSFLIWTGPVRRFRAIAYSPDGQTLVLGGDALCIYMPATGSMKLLYNANAYADFPQFSSNGKQIVFLSRKGPNDYKVGIWDIAAHRLLRSIPLPPPPEN